ncbi:MAG: hypothetical protein RL154_205 [Pseudomonadota bacterium]|jgi:protein TonB
MRGSLSVFLAVGLHAVAITFLLMIGMSNVKKITKQEPKIEVSFLQADIKPIPKPVKKEPEKAKKQILPQKVVSTTDNKASNALLVQKSENTTLKSNDDNKKPLPVTLPDFNADYLHNPAPIYPIASKKMREEGKVVLKVLVSSNGEALKTEIKTSSGFERLDNAALNAVSRWKFVPAKSGEQNIEAWVNVPITFKLGA